MQGCRMRLPEWKYLRCELEYKWENLAARKWINENPKLVILLSCASFAVLMVVIIWLLWPANENRKMLPVAKAWFYDLNTGELFSGKISQIPPIEAPSGPLPDGQPAGVKAYVFVYTGRTGNSEPFIGYLETTDANVSKDKAAVEPENRSSKEISGDALEGKLIRRVTDEQWFSTDSNEGRAILKEILIPDANGQRAYYYPPK